MTNPISIQKDIRDFENDSVINRVIRYGNHSVRERCIFIPNWRAKAHHWEGFCNHLAQFLDIDYFETREKPSARPIATTISYANKHIASDIINYLNAQSAIDYHLILCSFSAPLVFSHWDELHHKPKSLVLICPISRVSMPWPVRLFSILPMKTLPFLYKGLYRIANKVSSIQAICKNHVDLFKDGNMHEIGKFQSSVREVMKLHLPYKTYSKACAPTLVVKPKNDKIHCPVTCHKINRTIRDSVLHEVENFKTAHSVEVAKKIYHFISSNRQGAQNALAS
jgi:hypothetical protein